MTPRPGAPQAPARRPDDRAERRPGGARGPAAKAAGTRRGEGARHPDDRAEPRPTRSGPGARPRRRRAGGSNATDFKPAGVRNKGALPHRQLATRTRRRRGGRGDYCLSPAPAGREAKRSGMPHYDAAAKRARYGAPALLMGYASSRRGILERRPGSVRSRRIAGRRHGGAEGEARPATNGTQRPQRGACAPFWRDVRPRGADGDGGRGEPRQRRGGRSGPRERAKRARAERGRSGAERLRGPRSGSPAGP